MTTLEPVDTPEAPLLPAAALADGTMRRLLESALVLFGARGFHGVSVREIAAATGVRAASIYAHVASKESILADLMQLGHDAHQSALRSALLDAGPEPVDQIAALVDAHVRFHAAFPLLGRVRNRELAALTPDSAERVLATRVGSEKMFVDVIDRGIRMGAFHVPEAWLPAAAILAMGLRVAEWWGERDGYGIDDVAGRYALFAIKLLT